MQEPLRAGLSLVRWTFGLPAQKSQVKQKNSNSVNSPTHLCGVRVHLPLGLVGGRGNRPMHLYPGPSREWAESEREASLMLHACGGTCLQMLQR